MQTINNRMTETQIADLFNLAVQLQVKAEESDDRDTAILAYSIQNACSNLTESQREFRAADATIHNLELKLTDMAVQLANAESKCRELVAESGVLKASIPPLKIINDVTDSWDDVSLAEDVGFNLAISAIMKNLSETPATDAFLAEVRAQGVESYAEQLKSEADRAEETGWEDAAKFLRSESEKVLAFAAQLRKGAAL